MQFAIDLRARRHVALLVVGVTLGAGSAWSTLTAPLSPLAGGLGVAVAGGLVATQLRELARVGWKWDMATEVADREMQTLMLKEDEDKP